MMLEIAVMIEGQDGLNWPRWQKLVEATESLGFVGLYRSDHYTNARPPDKDSLELWISLTWLADNTERIEFGPLVSPLSFRDPTMTARMAAGVDDLSGGRLTLGLGAGWQEREHTNYGWDLLDIPDRFVRFEEGLEIVMKLLKNDAPSHYEGTYYQLNEGILLPRPQRAGGPPILIGGNGLLRTLPMAAQYASEWNGIYLSVERFRKRNSRLNELIIEAGRKPEDVRRSMMIGCVFGYDQADVEEKVAKRSGGTRTIPEYRDLGLVVGTGEQIAEQLQVLEEAGLQRAMLQWLDLDDIAGLEALAGFLLN
jgi:F420-dependent oxidoreductase-like protein